MSAITKGKYLHSNVVYNPTMPEELCLLTTRDKSWDNDVRCWRSINHYTQRPTQSKKITQANLTISWGLPDCSPDLNPIEELWDQLGRAATTRMQDNTTLEQLWDILTEEWNAIAQVRVTQLINSMRRRCVACVNAHGGYTRYWDTGNVCVLTFVTVVIIGYLYTFVEFDYSVIRKTINYILLCTFLFVCEFLKCLVYVLIYTLKLYRCGGLDLLL